MTLSTMATKGTTQTHSALYRKAGGKLGGRFRGSPTYDHEPTRNAARRRHGVGGRVLPAGRVPRRDIVTTTTTVAASSRRTATRNRISPLDHLRTVDPGPGKPQRRGPGGVPAAVTAQRRATPTEVRRRARRTG